MTTRGRPVAMLTPLPEAGLWQRLVAEGRLEPAADADRTLPPPLDPAGEPPMSDVLDQLREDSV